MGGPTTLAALITASAAQLSKAGVSFGHGTTNAHDEAAWLVLWCLGLPLDTDTYTPDGPAGRPVADADLERVAALLQARIETRKPAAYLTGEAWLQGVPFTVDERVIVPRSLIAELIVQGGFDYWLREDTRNALDLCTGGGSLAILAAMTYPEIVMVASDLSPDALDVARINVQRHGLLARIALVCGAGLEPFAQGCFDLVLCNPPYVNARSMAALPPEYRAEPMMALDGNIHGGTNGMDFVRVLLREAPACLAESGVMVLEIGNEYAHFEAAFPNLDVLWLETSAGSEQVLLVTREALINHNKALCT